MNKNIQNIMQKDICLSKRYALLFLCMISILLFLTSLTMFANAESVNTISIEKGNQLISEKKFNELLELSNTIIQKNSTDFNANYFKGRGLFGLGQYSEATKVFENILKEHEITTNLVLFYYGLSLSETGRYDLAIKYFDYIDEHDDLYDKSLIEKGNALTRIGNFTEALTAFNKVLTLNPESESAQINKANTFSKMNRNEEALSIIDKVLTSNPDNVSALITKGMILKNDGKLVKALEIMDEVIKRDKNNLIALNQKALILVDLERYDESLIIYDSLIEKHPTDMKLLNDKGVVLIKSNRGNEALVIYDKILQANQNDTDALLNRGAYFYTNENYDDALLDFDKILSIKPDDLGALKNKYLVLGKLEKHVEALNVIEKILKIKPTDEVVLKDRDIALSYIINERSNNTQIGITLGIIASLVGSALLVIRSLRKNKIESKKEISKKTYVILALPIWLFITGLFLIYADLRPDFSIFDKNGNITNEATLVLEIGISASLSMAIFLYSYIDQIQMSEIVFNTNAILSKHEQEKTIRIKDFLKKGTFALSVLNYGAFRRDILLESHNDDYRNRLKHTINFELNENTIIKFSIDELNMIRASGLFPDRVDKILVGVCREAQKKPYLNDINHLEYPSSVSYAKLHTMIQSAQREFKIFESEISTHNRNINN